MLRFATDEDFDWNIIRGLLRFNPELDIITAQESGVRSAADTDVLAWAASEGRVLLSHDVNTMRGLAYRRIASGETTSGVILVRKAIPIGRIIEALELAARDGLESEWQNRVDFLRLP